MCILNFKCQLFLCHSAGTFFAAFLGQPSSAKGLASTQGEALARAAPPQTPAAPYYITSGQISGNFIDEDLKKIAETLEESKALAKSQGYGCSMHNHNQSLQAQQAQKANGINELIGI